MRNPVVLRIVTILDLVSLSILDLLEYGMSAKDINYAMANGVIQFAEIPKSLAREETGSISITKVAGDYYYDRQVRLTKIGLYILDSLKCEQVEHKSPHKPKEPSSESYPHYSHDF